MDANCTRNCWIAGAGLGLLVWIFSAGLGTAGWLGGLFLGVIAGVLLGLVLIWALCRGHAAMDGSEWHPGMAATPAADPVTTHRPRGSDAEAVSGFVGASTAPASSRQAGGSDAPQPVAPHAQPDIAPSGHAQPGDGARRPEPESNDIYANAEPAATKEDSGQGDDLKRIKGIGPKLEETLRDNGVTRFDQIAAWDESQVDRFAEIVGRMGSRIRSDDWVGQAQLLASGGETEFSQRVEKGDVY